MRDAFFFESPMLYTNLNLFPRSLLDVLVVDALHAVDKLIVNEYEFFFYSNEEAVAVRVTSVSSDGDDKVRISA